MGNTQSRYFAFDSFVVDEANEDVYHFFSGAPLPKLGGPKFNGLLRLIAGKVDNPDHKLWRHCEIVGAAPGLEDDLYTLYSANRLIYRIRNALGRRDPKYPIKNVPRRGYELACDVYPLEADEFRILAGLSAIHRKIFDLVRKAETQPSKQDHLKEAWSADDRPASEAIVKSIAELGKALNKVRLGHLEEEPGGGYRFVPTAEKNIETISFDGALRSISGSELIVKRIVRTDDPDLDEGFRDLYEDRIDEDARNPFGDITRWVSEHEEESKDCREHPWVGYVFVAKIGAEVVGLLHGVGHRPTGYLFINWLATVTGGPSNGVVRALLAAWLDAIRADKFQPKMAVYEYVSNDPKMLSRLRWDDGRAQRWARELTGRPTRPYQLRVRYLQPLLDPQQIHQQDETRGILIYVPLDGDSEVTSKRQVEEILKTVLLEWYQSTFDDNFRQNVEQSGKYREYLKSIYRKIMKSYPSDPLGKLS